LGQYQQAIDQEAKVLELQPSNVNAFAGLMGNYLALGNIEMANAVFDKALALSLDHPMLALYRYHTAFLAGDNDTMQKQLQLLNANPGADALRSAESDTKAYYGRLKEARALSEQAARSARASGDLETAAGWKANAAMREAAVGTGNKALSIGTDALQMSGGKYVKLQVALAFARAGQSAEAKKIVSALDREYPQDTIVQNYWLPAIQAAIELNNGNGQKAIELLQVTEPYELGEALQGYMYPVYLRGQAYLMLHQGDKAAAEFQKILNHRGIVVNFVLGSLARLQLARAEQMNGDTASARKDYAEFLKLWKDADQDLPIFHEALNESKRLK
jgi:tetratricopeptide (TPR) repeat protein